MVVAALLFWILLEQRVLVVGFIMGIVNGGPPANRSTSAFTCVAEKMEGSSPHHVMSSE